MQKGEYYLRSKLNQFKRFAEYYSINYNEEDIINHFQQNLDIKPKIEDISNYIIESNDLPKLIIDMLYLDFFSNSGAASWNNIKKDPESVRKLIDILIEANKLIPEYKKIPLNLLCDIFSMQSSYSIHILNQNIFFLTKFIKNINQFYEFLVKEKIKFKKVELWQEILSFQEIFITDTNPEISLWTAFSNCIILNDDLDFKQEIKNIIVFYYVQESYPEELQVYLKAMQNSIISCKILYYISQNREDESLGPYIENCWHEFTGVIKDLDDNIFFNIFFEQIQQGKFILNTNRMFEIYIEKETFDLSYLNQLFFNPLIPIDFEYAINYYFKMNTSINTLLRNLKIEGKQKLFLLTFTSEKGRGGIAQAINDLDDEEKYPDLSSKYSLLQYSDSARIGISKKGVLSLEELRTEMLNDLKKTIPQLDSTKTLIDNFNKFLEKCYVPLNILTTKEKRKFKDEFNEFIHFNVPNSHILEKLDRLNKSLKQDSKYDKVDKDFRLYWSKLHSQIKNYPPDYQILLHELENDPKKINVFGNYQKIDPFIKIKELYAYRTSDKESLLISAEFRDESLKRITIKEINEKLIESLNFFSLVSKEIESLQKNPQYEMILNKDFLVNVISSYYSKSKSLLEFCLALTDKMGLKKTYYELDEFKKNIDEIISNNVKIIEDIVKILNSHLSTYTKIFDEKLVKQMASSFVKSCTCISLTIFNKIQEAYRVFNEEKIKDLKNKILTEIDLDIIREKRFKLVFHNLLSFYRSNKIRPLDADNEEEFHHQVYKYLLNFFPNNIEDESDVAHGRLDLLVYGIPIELKFETKNNRIESIYKDGKDQFYDYLYKKEKKIGFLYVYEKLTKGPEYPKNDIEIFKEQGYYCVTMILRGGFTKSTDIKRN